MGRLDNVTVMVTGGGSGIGRAGAIAMAAEGARVAVLDIDDALATRVADEITGAGGAARPGGPTSPRPTR
ncbi:SDR family NAD(P)-dependent oxidoreductase [Micromonospora zhanjiangensis]